ncbi:MAG: two-component system response regulator LytT [Olleya marilimosa]|jgi:two-component system response regulator LytT|uniref:Response regulator transcription factor n=1 Tax=Olleya marilimosa TaxID=272164 RepID=A0ABR8LWU2_9FLAO|nr:LytTR family DNA-binding domain-containing protein [Olleya marilimosa]MBD3864091.1 response regulator transcription factor [Olleya marilimosa]MBD3891567.1 response regulator transcription factor [Olleya marilimosa]
MNCIIIDDEATARMIISQLCSNVPSLNVLEEFPNAMQAIKYLNQNEIDLIFLDIHMPDFTGFDFIDTLKNPPKIILTTSDPNFAIQAFEYDCIVDYLVKPITLERFKKAIDKAEAKKITTPKEVSKSEKVETSSGNDLYVNIDRRLIKIDIPSIYLVEAKGDYIQVKTEDKNYTVHSTLKKIEDKLPDNLFLKVHRSYIINIKKIIDIEDNSVLIKKDVIPVSRSNRPELMKRLNLL